MKSTRNGKTYHCPFDAAIDVIGGKWKMGIIWHLGENVMRFNELQKVLPGVSAKTLTNQLRELEEDGILLRTAYPEVPRRVEYRVTGFGKTLIPVMQALCDWGGRYLETENGNPCPTTAGKK